MEENLVPHKQGEDDMVIVMGTARLGPGEMERLLPDMQAQLAATRAEDGCESYVFARDVLDPDVLQISERWRDNDALAAHFHTPHMAKFNAAIGAANVLSLVVKAYDENGERTLMGK
jgi:quinol monooxygenase YgiN